MTYRVALLVALMIGACGNPNVGANCTTNADCDDGLTCDPDSPGGYCTMSCMNTNTAGHCPDGSVCNWITPDAEQCVKLCTDDTDCGTGQWCTRIFSSSSDTSGCRPLH